MAFGAVVDTCALYPFSLCDILLRLAERELFDVYWSERILEELERNLAEKRVTPEQARYRVNQMRAAFPAASVPAPVIARLEPAMTNDPKDRHVLAAAVASPAEVVVTFNLQDFPETACALYDVEAVHPDEFLRMLFDLDPPTVRAAIIAQAAALQRPPVSRDELLRMLSAAGVSRFAALL